jgi:hypothetical protein
MSCSMSHVRLSVNRMQNRHLSLKRTKDRLVKGKEVAAAAIDNNELVTLLPKYNVYRNSRCDRLRVQTQQV